MYHSRARYFQFWSLAQNEPRWSSAARSDNPVETRAFLNILGGVLADARRSKQLTQERLAERLDATAQWVSQVERGQGSPSVDMLLRLAGALDTTLPALLQAACELDSVAPEVRELLRVAQGLSPRGIRVLTATAKAIAQEEGGS